MKLALSVAAILAAVILFENKPADTSLTAGDEKSGYLNVSKTKNIESVKSPDSNVEIFVNVDSIKVDHSKGIEIRSGEVVYQFKKPVEFQGKKVKWMYSKSYYSCKDKMFIVEKIALLDESFETIHSSEGDGEVEVANAGSVALAELEFICKQKPSKSKGKSKYIDI